MKKQLNLFCASLIWLAFSPVDAGELEGLSIEELMEQEVTTPAKRPQSLANTAAAVSVITQEDIRRSGATSLPEALRLAPGVNVARLNANRWAVSIRGNADRFANKLLVLLDGRTLYTPFFGGVFWETQDILLEEINRIEVIRGPGAAVWGANAVNGVINIITQHAGDSQGERLMATVGTEERATLAAMGGIALAEDNYLRFSAKWRKLDESVDADGHSLDDAVENWRIGGRWDALTEADRFTVSGNYYQGVSGDTFTTPLLEAPWQRTDAIDEDYDGAALLARWERDLGDGAALSVQGFVDYTHLQLPLVEEERVTMDLEVERREAPIGVHELTWGLSYRRSEDEVNNSDQFRLNPSSRTLQYFSLFLQDEIELVPDQWRLTLGGRLEHNDFTGVEFQPSARLWWSPVSGHSLWTSLSRATRSPSRTEDDMRTRIAVIPPGTPANPGPLPVEVVIFGNRDLDSEVVNAFEIGYRGQWDNSLSLEVVGFVNEYNSLVLPQEAPPIVLDDRIVLPLPEHNLSREERSSGFEIAADWRLANTWRVAAAYSYLDGFGNYVPHHLSLRLSHNPTADTEVDLWLKHAAAFEGALDIPSYTTLDARISWRSHPDLEFTLVGQNLLDESHPEMESLYFNFTPALIERSVYLRAEIEF